MPEKKEQEEQKDDPKKKADAPRSLGEKIGFAKLDLTIEEVEERISPRETNVFDK